jgi:hypothetical protein
MFGKKWGEGMDSNLHFLEKMPKIIKRDKIFNS